MVRPVGAGERHAARRCRPRPPKNPRHPATWHAREYGLLAANIFGLHDYDKNVKKGTGDFTLEPGKTVICRLIAVALLPLRFVSIPCHF